MAVRSVFEGVPRYPFYKQSDVSFCYFADKPHGIN